MDALNRIMNYKRIFISGGAGVIGNELIALLHAAGAILFVGDLKPRPKHWPPEIQYRQGDLNFISADEISAFRPDVFIHLAATFERSSENYEFWDDNFWHNVRLSNYLMTIFKEISSLKRVIFASSYLVYNPDLYSFREPQQRAFRLSEDHPVFPRNLTGSAKLHHEIELNFLKRHKSEQFSAVSLRIFRGYGRGSRCVISRWIRALLRNQPIAVYRKEGLFDYIYAGEIAKGIQKVLDCDQSSGVMNLGNDNARRVADVIHILSKYFPRMQIVEHPSDILYEASQANMDLFQRITGWKPQLQLEDAIPLLIEHERRALHEDARTLPHHVLVCSSSSKIPLIEQVKVAAKKIDSTIKVYAADSNPSAISQYFADFFWHMPRLSDLSIDELIKYCVQHRINAIIPSRDGELEYFARFRHALQQHGISVMVSDLETIKFCFDKLLFFKNNRDASIPIIQTSESISDIDSRYFVVKERFGAGSKNIRLKVSMEQAVECAGDFENAIFQPYIEGKEASVDMYISKKRKLMGVVMRYRNQIHDGESIVSTTFFDERLRDLSIRFASAYQFYGHILLQVIIDQHNNYHIVECNPRFGGASSLSIASGLDSFYWFLLEAQHEDISNYYYDHYPFRSIMQIRYNAHKLLYLR